MTQSNPQKLRIPAPPDPSDDSFGVVELGLLASAMFGALVMWWFVQQPAPETHQAAHSKGDEQHEQISDQMLVERVHAEKLEKLKPSQLSSREWPDDDVRAIFTFGSRSTAELVCGKRAAQISANKLPDSLRLELVKSLDRRSKNAPYACLSRLFFAGTLPQKDLQAEMEEFWTEATAWEGNPDLVSEALNTFRFTRDRPDTDRFNHWLRACSLNFDYGGSNACQRLLNQIAPAQGGDLLLTYVKHLEESELSSKDHQQLAKGLGHLVRDGQPASFKVSETKELPDYDVDFRNAAVLFLCRQVNSPDDEAAFAAAEELTKSAHFGARSYDKNTLSRWREGCRVAFGGKPEDKYLKMLAVSTGVEGEAPDYRLSTAVKSGECELKEGYPSWYCGAQLWIGEGDMSQALEDIFVKTAWMEWVDE